MRIFSTTEEFDAWRTASTTVPEVAPDNARLDEAIVDDMITVHTVMDQLNPFGEPTVLVGYYSPAVDELVKCLYLGGARPLFGTLVETTEPTKEPRTTDTFIQTLGGRPYEAVHKQVEPTIDDPFTDEEFRCGDGKVP